MPNFFLCHNPLSKMPPGRVAYIYHADSPRIFVSVIEIEFGKPLNDLNFKGCNILFGYNPGDGSQRLFLMIVMQGGARDIDTTISTLQEAAGWFCSCLNKEDVARFGKAGTWTLMAPYDKIKAPNLVVVHLEATDQFLMSYGNGTFLAQGLDHFYKMIDLLYKDDQGRAIGDGHVTSIRTAYT
jgi:hypothetical protein